MAEGALRSPFRACPMPHGASRSTSRDLAEGVRAVPRVHEVLLDGLETERRQREAHRGGVGLREAHERVPVERGLGRRQVLVAEIRRRVAVRVARAQERAAALARVLRGTASARGERIEEATSLASRGRSSARGERIEGAILGARRGFPGGRGRRASRPAAPCGPRGARRASCAGTSSRRTSSWPRCGTRRNPRTP